jgi:ATP-dependent DNA ligase
VCDVDWRELVAIAERDKRPVQDFAAVGRAIFDGGPAAAARLRFVAFDLLELAGEDLRHQSWRVRDGVYRELVRKPRICGRTLRRR